MVAAATTMEAPEELQRGIPRCAVGLQCCTEEATGKHAEEQLLLLSALALAADKKAPVLSISQPWQRSVKGSVVEGA